MNAFIPVILRNLCSTKPAGAVAVREREREREREKEREREREKERPNKDRNRTTSRMGRIYTGIEWDHRLLTTVL
jgi:hypothetical protein